MNMHKKARCLGNFNLFSHFQSFFSKARGPEKTRTPRFFFCSHFLGKPDKKREACLKKPPQTGRGFTRYRLRNSTSCMYFFRFLREQLSRSYVDLHILAHTNRHARTASTKKGMYEKIISSACGEVVFNSIRKT